MKKFCPNCGKELKPNATFCANCGFKLPQAKEQPSQPKEAKTQATEATQPKAQVFCPSCGHPLKPKATFCTNCGYNLVTKQKAAPAKQAPAARQQVAKAPRQPMKKKTKVWLSICGVLILALIGFYIWGSQYYSKNNQLNRIGSGLMNPKQDISSYVQADTPDMKVTKQSVQPLQNYYQDHKTAVTKMINGFHYSNYGNKYISLVRNGRYFLFFPKYKLQVKTFQPEVSTNHSDSTVTVNGKSIGKLNSDDSDRYSKKLDLVFPGKYHFNVKSKVAGRTLTATSTVDIFANRQLNMDIKTQTFSVKSVPNGVVYINDKKVGTLDKDGKLEFKDYPITRNMQLYVIYTTGGKSIQSETVTDMADEFGAFDDDDYGYDDDEDDDYNDDASDNGEDVTKEDGEYVVEPKWKGVISTGDAEELLNRAFGDVDDDDFVDGSANKSYSDLKTQQKGWNDNDKIDGWQADVDVEAVYPAGDDSCNIVYRVNYRFDNGDSTKKQIMDFKGAVIQKDGSDQKIKTIGNGKLISSKDEDN